MSVDAGSLQLSSNLEETLRGRPAVVALILSRRMACPGCAIAPFEDLADAARHHGMDGEELLAAVRREVAGAAAGSDGRHGSGRPTGKGGAAGGAGRRSGRDRAPRRRSREET